MLVAPQPRFRFYNGFRNYFLTAGDAVRGRVFRGDATARTEQAVAAMLGARNVILTPQGRYAIYLGLKDLLKPGQNVVMSPYTLYDVVNMVIAAGGVPRFADIDRETCNLSPEAAAAAIDVNTGAVLVTHLHGLMSRMDEFQALCAERGVPLLEDACQAFGARWGGRRAGTLGEIGFFSCGRAKNINAFLGGMLATADDARATRIRATLADLPHEDGKRLRKRVAHCLMGQVLTTPPVFSLFTYWVFRHGVLHDKEAVTRQFNTEANPVLRRAVPEAYERRMSETQARLIADQLGRADSYTEGRIALARIYHDGLKDIPGLILPPMREDGSHIYLAYAVQVPNRNALQKYMMEQGRDVVIQHIGNTADLDCFAEYRRDCPSARATANSVLLLPTYPGYTAAQARKNVEVIRRFFATHNRRAG